MVGIKSRTQKAENENENSEEGSGENSNLAFDFNQSFEHMDWWPDLADLDRLNILNSPKEDRARLLASKYSKPVVDIMVEIGRRTDL